MFLFKITLQLFYFKVIGVATAFVAAESELNLPNTHLETHVNLTCLFPRQDLYASSRLGGGICARSKSLLLITVLQVKWLSAPAII